MLFRNAVFSGKSETQRLAQANASKLEIENTWKTAKQNFQDKWPHKGHKLIFIIQEGYKNIDAEDATDVITEINLREKHEPIDVILHTHGGSAIASDRIAEALVREPQTTAYVPFYAESGGTEIALATRKIILGRGAGLSPVDMQLAGWPARDWIQLAKERGDKASEEVLMLAKTAERLLKDETRKVCELINRRHKGWFGWRGCSLARELTSGDRFHGEIIRYSQAKRLGINASNRLPRILYEFISMRREQLRLLRELEEQISLVQQKMSETTPVLAST